MTSRLQRHQDLDGRRVPAGTSVLPVRAIGPVRAVSARRRIVGIDGAAAAADAVDPVQAAVSTGTGLTREVRNERDIVAKRNVKLRSHHSWLARYRDSDMPDLPVADSGILRKRYVSFLVSRDNACRDL